ncbi:MAG TPA: ferritin-like domain-containing protein [Thermoanaerobaculia bacterium]|jgi:rubrerythrin
MNPTVENLLYEALETEIGGIQVYTNALACAKNPGLKKEWQEYLEQTKRHEKILRGVFATLGLDAGKQTPGREVVRHTGQSLVQAMQIAKQKGEAAAAEIVAAECVVLAETKDHLNWELIGEIAKKATGEQKKALSDAHDEVEDEEDEHLYHTQGWTRELWLGALGLPAVLPPPEERRDVKTAIGAALAKKARSVMPKRRKDEKEPRPSRARARASGRRPRTAKRAGRTR